MQLWRRNAADALARLDAVDGRINAVVDHRPEEVLVQAERIDADRARGAVPGPLGVPALTVTTGLVGRTPVGVQLVAAHYREDLCLAAGAAIEAGGVPEMPVEPA